MKELHMLFFFVCRTFTRQKEAKQVGEGPYLIPTLYLKKAALAQQADIIMSQKAVSAERAVPREDTSVGNGETCRLAEGNALRQTYREFSH